MLVMEYVLFLNMMIALYLPEFPAPLTPVVNTPSDQLRAPEDAEVFAEIARDLVEPSFAFDP